MIYQVAQDTQTPLLNLYGLGANKPQLLAGDKLSDPGAPNRANFTQPALDQFGVNNAVLAMLRTLHAIRTAANIQ